MHRFSHMLRDLDETVKPTEEAGEPPLELPAGTAMRKLTGLLDDIEELVAPDVLGDLFERPTPKGKEGLDPVVPFTPRIEGATGRGTSIVFADGTRVKAVWRVTEIDDLQASHSPFTWATNPDYPAGVQNRGYREADQQLFAKRITTFDAGMATDLSENAAVSVPAGRPGGEIVLGHERTMRRLWLARKERGKETDYLETLAQPEKSSVTGIEPADYADLEHPFLWKEITDPEWDLSDRNVLRELNRLSDMPPQKAHDPVSEAMSRARSLEENPAALTHFVETMEDDHTLKTYLATANGREFVTQLQASGVFGEAEVAAFRDPKTLALTEDGVKMVEHVLQAAAIGDADVLNLARGNIKGILAKLEHAYPEIIMASKLGDFDIRGDLQEALTLHVEMAGKEAKTIYQMIDEQVDLLPRDDSRTAVTLAKFIGRANKTEIKEAFRQYRYAAKVSTDEAAFTGNLFGQDPTTPAEAFRKAFGRVDNPQKPCR